MMTEQIMHMGIENPREKRREILGAAINSIELLKHFEGLKKLNTEKDIYKKKFAETMKEIHILVDEFRELLPKVEEEEKPEPIQAKEKPKKKEKKEEKQQSREEINLEDDIAELRRKIENL